MSFRQGRGAFCAAVLALTAASVWPDNPSAPAPANLPLAAILEQMQRHTEIQAEALKHYRALRHYQPNYHGYAANIEGKMLVQVTFAASAGNILRVFAP